jgi:hypothetical protein
LLVTSLLPLLAMGVLREKRLTFGFDGATHHP